eukprot:TRINITY_DN3654_c0_g2_i3.p1 TRINITY_DN3654_c0_g2~~TRINITY_DN3654_c0_g2_i3.p1  ORF type:complete len:627 (+),score=103.37 TRINITY_DN3654_c0_g2_i3:227-2107(+)
MRLLDSEKYEPIIISTSRGMGKTFFMKKLVKGDLSNIGTEPIKMIQDAYKLGRVATMEASHMDQFLVNTELINKFWQMTIIFNLTYIFDETRVDGINFENRSISSILACLTTATTPLEKWIKQVLNSSVDNACKEMIRLTNIAFHQQDLTTRPVFLIDNVQYLAKQTDIQSTKPGLNHTKLSCIINQLISYRVLAIFAGTTSGNIELVAEYSNFVPIYIHLSRLNTKNAYTMYCKLCERKNNLNNLVTPITPLEKKDPIFVALTYESYRIPRLLKIVYGVLYEGQLKQFDSHFILEKAFHDARYYYKDALSQILEFSVEDCAKILLFCSVNYKLTNYIPTTTIRIEDLQNKALIFPYLDDSYVVPVMFWVGLNENMLRDLKSSPKILEKWNEVMKKIETMIPGIDLNNLFISSGKWWNVAYDIYSLGSIWEKLFATSLVVKYYLARINRQIDDIDFLDIYYLTESAQAYKTMLKTKVNFLKGLETPSSEASVKQKLDKAVYINSNIHNARHDIVFYAKPANIMVQCKNSVYDPNGSTISLQLEKNHILLWVYPGFKEDKPDPPKRFEVQSVKDSLKARQLAFLSGAGSISLITVDLIIQLKKVVMQSLGTLQTKYENMEESISDNE